MFTHSSYNRGVFIALLYLVFGFGWILITDYISDEFNGSGLGTFQT